MPRVTDWDGSTATVLWDRPRSDGGARIQGYKVEFRDVQDGVWNSADYLVKDCNYQVCDATRRKLQCYSDQSVSNATTQTYIKLNMYINIIF